MNDFGEAARSCLRKVRFDARDRVLCRQHPAASHRAQSLAGFQFLRRLLKRTTTSNQKKRRERNKYGAETHEYEYEAMFAKGEHNATCLTDRSNAGRRAMLARGATSGRCQSTKTLQVTPSSFGRGPG